jgi:hypothetical protein
LPAAILPHKRINFEEVFMPSNAYYRNHSIMAQRCSWG